MVLHGRVPVIPSDGVMHLLPEPFNHVVLRRIGWQKVEHEAAPELTQPGLGLSRLVNDAVVQDEMELLRVGGQFKIDQVWALQNRPPQCGEI